MKSSFACLRPFPIILLFAVILGPVINRSVQAIALSPVQGGSVTTAFPIDQGRGLGINDRTILAKVVAQARDESSPTESDESLANMDEVKSSGWWMLWFLGLPLLILVIGWVLSKEDSHGEIGESEKAEDGMLPALAAGNDRRPLPAANPMANPVANLVLGLVSNPVRGHAEPTAAIASPHLLPSWLPSQLVLIPEVGQTVGIYWQVTSETKAAFRQQGGERLVLQVYDVTNIDPRQEKPHSVQQFDCDETTSELRVTVPLVNRCYLADLGYITRDGQWLRLAHSAPTSVVDEGDPADRGSDSLGQMDDLLVLVPVDTPNGQTRSAAVAHPADTNGNSGSMERAIAPLAGSETEVPTSDAFPSQPPTPIWIAASNWGTVHIWWELPEAIATFLQQQGIQTLELLLHDVTWIDLNTCPPHHTEQVQCDVMERDRTLPIWATDRDYLAELGYTDAQGQWVRLAQSTHIGIAAP